MEKGNLWCRVACARNKKWAVVRDGDVRWMAAEPIGDIRYFDSHKNSTLDRYFDFYEDAIKYAIEQAYGKVENENR